MSVELLDIELEHLGTLPNGKSFEWESVGDGEPMLWIEGGPGFPAHLGRPEAELFGRRFKAHLVNAPGCGRSSPPDRLEEYDLAGHVAFFDSVRRALQLDALTVVGHSWGGLTAMAYAALEPDAVTRLIILDGYAGGGSVLEADAQAEQERVFDRVRDRSWFGPAETAINETFAMSGPSEQAFIDAFTPAWPLYFAEPELPTNRHHIERLTHELRYNVDVGAIWDMKLEAEDHRPLAAMVKCPTLILVGEHDFICGPTWGRATANAIPGAHYEEIPNTGHFPQYEDPDRVLAAVTSWLRGVGSGPQVNSKEEMDNGKPATARRGRASC